MDFGAAFMSARREGRILGQGVMPSPGIRGCPVGAATYQRACKADKLYSTKNMPTRK